MSLHARCVDRRARFWFLLNGLAMAAAGAQIPTLFSAVVFAVGYIHGYFRIERLSEAGCQSIRRSRRNDFDGHDR